MKQQQICTSLIQTCFISKFNKNVKEKGAGNQEKTVSTVGTGKEILLNCKGWLLPMNVLSLC